MNYYSAIKRNEILPLATTWMVLEGIMLSKISQTDRERQILLDFTYMWDLQNKTSKTETDSQIQRTNYGLLPGG